MAMQGKQLPSFAGQFLKRHRAKHNLTQEQLAEDIIMEPRTLRAYENGERQLTNINELHRIADLLGVNPEDLGLAASLYTPRTPEEIEKIIDHAWKLTDESRLPEARAVIERLVHNLRTQITTEDPQLLENLAHAYHAAGYIISEATSVPGAYESLPHYQQMESIARILKNHTLLNTALTYQGDMYRRLGNLEKATTYLEAARDTTPQADKSARGNGLQLLARVYFKKDELGKFERAMEEAEKLSYAFDPEASSTRGHYSPSSVYEDYALKYGDLRRTQLAIEYLQKAKAHSPQTKFWELLLMTSEAIVLVKGNEIKDGVQLAIEAAEKSREAGVYRFLDRIKTIDKHIENLEKQLGTIRKPLQEAIYGGKVIDF